MNKITVLLPIKKNSQRLPGKVFMDFFGKPLYRVILDKLVSLDVVSEIIVNTDSEVIMKDCHSRNPKVKIIERPVEICGDTVSMNSIIKYDLSHSQEEHFLQTHVTNPLLQSETITKAINQYFSNLPEYDSLVGVVPVYKRVWTSDFHPVNHRNNIMLQTQDLQPVLVENSNIFIFSKSSFYSNGQSRIGNKPFPFYMDAIESTDIDHYEEMELAKYFYGRIAEKNEE